MAVVPAPESLPASQAAAMLESSFFYWSERPSHKTLETEAMTSVVQEGDGEQRCGVLLAWRQLMFK